MRRISLSFALLASAGLALAAGCGSNDDDDNGGGGTSAEGGGSAEGGSAGAAATGGGIITTGGQGQAGGDVGGSGGINCGETAMQAEPVEVNVLLVLDASGSMTSGDDKWGPLTSAVDEVITGVGDEISFGLEIFPYSEGTSCAVEECCVPEGDAAILVPVGLGTETGPEIVSTLQAYAPDGYTPTAEALQRALDYFTEGAGAELTGDKYVLLGTDGGPNCNANLTCSIDDCTANIEEVCQAPDGVSCCESIPAEDGARLCLDASLTTNLVEALAEAGIRTIVVGLPGANRPGYTQLLNALAVAGGQTNPAPEPAPDYFPVDNTTELVSVLQTVTNRLIRTCDLQLDEAPPDTTNLNVKVDGEYVIRDDPDGWELDESTDPPTIKLVGTSCGTMMTQGASSVQIVYGCPPIF